MPNWKKLIVSGSDAALNSLNISTSFTASGLTYPSQDNGEFSFIQTDGNGNLSLQYVETLYEQVINGESTTILKGTPVYVSGSQGADQIIYRADAGDPTKMPAIYIAGDNIAPNELGRGILLGLITGVNTTGYPSGTEVYVGVGGGWTSSRPTGSVIVQSLGIVTKEGNGGQGVVLNPGPNNLPNIPQGHVWVGDSNSHPEIIPTSSFYTGSYTGSFTGDGSGLTNLPIVGGGVPSTRTLTINGESFDLSADRSWTVGNIIGSGSQNFIPKFTNSTSIGNSLIFDDGTNVAIGSTTSTARLGIIPIINQSALSISSYSITGSSVTPAVDITGTWNTTGAPTLIRANVTNTASNVNSLLMDLQVGGTSQFNVGRTGNAYLNNTLSIGGGAIQTTAAIGRYGTLSLNGAEGNRSTFISNESISGSSGTWNYTTLRVIPVLNQTGTAAGITRGLLISPTLTAAADWRSVEWSNNTGWGLYGTGTANNYLAGKLLLGTTTQLTGEGQLQVNGQVNIATVNNATGSFLTHTDGIINKRTPSEVLSDIGGQATLVSGTNIKTINGESILGSGNITTPGITGTGTLNFLPKFTNSTSIGNSLIFDDGTNIGIGTTVASEKLSILGNLLITNRLLSSQQNLDIDSGATRIVAQIPSTIYEAVFFDFVIKKGTNMRAGTIYSVHNGTNIEFTETSTNDLGNTSEVVLSVDLSGGNVRLTATTLTNDWSIKTLIRGL
jgi:hypothetical protein